MERGDGEESKERTKGSTQMKVKYIDSNYVVGNRATQVIYREYATIEYARAHAASIRAGGCMGDSHAAVYPVALWKEWTEA